MGSDAVEKYQDETRTFSAKHKIAILICFSLSAALILSVFMFKVNSVKNTEETVPADDDFDEYEDPDYWMEEQDIIDDFENY